MATSASLSPPPCTSHPPHPVALPPGYLSLFDESRLVHISTIDCCILASLAPFWMSNDAELRGWEDRWAHTGEGRHSIT